MMKSARDNHGFTVGELLIAVAIVAVLVAIALPLFASSLADAKESVDAANCRSARAAATSVCLIDHNGDFSKKEPPEWVEIAVADGIPRSSQVDPSENLNCTIDPTGTRITFFYGEAPSSGGDSGGGNTGGGETPGGDTDPGTGGETPGGGADPDTPTPGPSGTTITVERDGVKYTVGSDDWNDFPSGTIPQGAVYSDESGVYVFKSQTHVDSSSKPQLDKMWETIEISNASRVFFYSDAQNGNWLISPHPKKGDILVTGDNSYYVFTQNMSYVPTPGELAPIKSEYIVKT